MNNCRFAPLLLFIVTQGEFLAALDTEIENDTQFQFFSQRAGELAQNNQCPPSASALPGLDFTIQNTWDDQPVNNRGYHFHLQWFVNQIPGQPSTCGVRCTFDAPLFNDPPPPNASAGYVPGLWEYEVTELFFANEHLEYVEIELEPHDHYMVYLIDGYRNPFNKGEKLKLNMTNTRDEANKIWRCTVDIPLAFFPPQVRTFNAYAIHGSGTARIYQAMAPVNGNGVYTKPDFHLLELYQKFNVSLIIPSGYNDVAFNDSFYGDLWDGSHISLTTTAPPPTTTGCMVSTTTTASGVRSFRTTSDCFSMRYSIMKFFGILIIILHMF